MRGYKLTDQQSINMLMDEIDKALTLPNNFDEIIAPIYKYGGNTYQSKTEKEMEVIKEKIRQTKLGSKNPMAKKIKRINIITNEVDIFDTIISCAKACGIKNGKTSISTRLNGQVKSPYKNTWIFEYYNE